MKVELYKFSLLFFKISKLWFAASTESVYDVWLMVKWDVVMFMRFEMSEGFSEWQIEEIKMNDNEV